MCVSRVLSSVEKSPKDHESPWIQISTRHGVQNCERGNERDETGMVGRHPRSL